MIPLMSAMAIGSTVSGLAQLGMGLMDRGRIKRERAEAKKAYEAAKKSYASMDISNPFENVQTEFENPFEDLTVNQQAAQFQRETMRQQQANTLNQLRGAAGGSGIGALAQALANQASVAAQQASASIAQQEAVNERLRAQGELQVQKGEMLAEQQRLAGAERSRALESRKTRTLFGMAQQRRAAADQAVAQANAALYSGIGQLGTSLLTGGVI